MNELLLDERRTLEVLNQNSLSFRQSFSLTSKETSSVTDKNSPAKRQRSRSRRSNQKRYDTKLKVKNKNYGFDMMTMLFIAMVIVLPLIIFQLVEYFNSSANSNQIRNALNLYSTMVDLLNTNMLMRLALVSSLVNPGVRYLNSSTATNSKVFLDTSSRLKNYLIPELVAMQKLDFGSDFNTKFMKIVAVQSVCEILEEQNNSVVRCGQGDSAYLNQTVESYFKWINVMTRDSHLILDFQQDKSVALKEIFSNRQFGSYLNSGLDGGAERKIYYAIMIPLANSIKVLIDPAINVGGSLGTYTMSANETKSEDYYLFFVIPLGLATAILLVYFVYWKLVWTYKAFWRTGLLIPVELIIKNPLLTKHLRQVESSTKSRISFF